MARTFQMQARSSDDGQLYTWPSAGSPDWSAAGYPGPGAPLDVALSVGGRLSPLLPPPLVFGAVSNRANYGNIVLSGGSYNFAKPFTVLCGPGNSLSSIQILLANSYGATELGPGGPMAANAQLEYPTGVYSRITFGGGNPLGSVADGGLMQSDDSALSVPVPHGATAVLRCRVQNSAGVPFCDAYYPDLTRGDALTSSTSDLTGTHFADTLGGAMFPAGILGLTSLPNYGIVGDSIAAGHDDISPDTDGARGVIAHRLAQLGRACVNVAIPGDTASSFLTNSAKRRAILQASGVPAIICEYITNDLYVLNHTAATAQANLQTLRALSGIAGLPFYQTTCLPQADSTDGYATTNNQTPRAQEPQRLLFEAWLRGGNFPGITDYIETADGFETSRNSGIIKAPGYTSDGTHMSTTAYKAQVWSIP